MSTQNKKVAAAKEPIKPERLMDLAVFFVGFDAFLGWLEASETPKNSFTQRGETLARRYMATLDEAVDTHVRPLTERPDATRIKAPFRRFDRSGSPSDRARFKAAFLKVLFGWFKSHQEQFRTTFSGKSRKSGMALIRVVNEDEAVAVVRQTAAVPAVSGLQAPRKWLAQAAEMMGAPLSDAESIMGQVESVANIADEARKVDAQLAGTDPGSDRAAKLTVKKAALLAKMEDHADGDPSILKAAAAATFSASTGHQTKTGQKLSLNSDQESAMMASGKKVVAAGAGSGKTRVLAGEVAYRINELGYAASSICAASFTRKSSKELVRRISDYGAVIDGAAQSGFGTTHYLAGVTILGKLGKGTKRPKYFSKKQNWAVTTLTALAVKQVGMKGAGGQKAPEPRNLFTDKPTNIAETVQQAEVPEFGTPPADDSVTRPFLDALSGTADFFEYGWPARWAPKGSGQRPGEWAEKQLEFLSGIGRAVARDGMNPADIDGWKRDKLLNLMGKANVTVPKFASRSAAAGEAPEADVQDTGKAEAKRKGMSKYQYFDKPAGQWFNLGHKWEGAGDKSGKEGQQFSAAGVKRKIDIWKGMGCTPEEVWYAAGPAAGKVQPFAPEAAAYAAYEWLKGNRGEPDFRNTGDMNDLLTDAVRTLVHNPRARSALQSRFKVILVDEAQDLNRTQHVLFSLLAGAIDHETLEPKADGSMTADTFGFIGDDKQAIYEFRGAEPEEFIDKSDLVPGGQDYETHLLDTNYRSGQAIVEAANNLIKHNTKQIPMVCKANFEVKGDGAVKAESFGDPSEAADMVAETIEDYAEANATADAKYSNYGIAVRSNAEAMHYALGMVKKAIPFKCKVNPFKSPPIKSMLGWLKLAEQGVAVTSMPKAAFLAAVKDSLRMPASYLGKAFTNRLEKQDNPAEWLLNVDPHGEFRGNYARNVEAFVTNLQVCMAHSGDENPSEVYASLLVSLKSSDGKSFFDGIIDNIKDNNDKMAELASENPDGILTDEQIEEAAEEELILLNGLMDSKDTLNGVMEYVEELKVVNEKVAAGEDDDKDAVTIGTMHSWKGLECPKMFIPMVRGKFPRARLEKNPDTGQLDCFPPDKDDPALASERRLAYVAITRAEDSCVMMDIHNPSKAFSGCGPSQFIEESCVKYAGADSAEGEEPAEGEPKAAMELDPLVGLWDEEQPPDDLIGPTDYEVMEMEMEEGLGLDSDPADPMLAMWFKTTDKGA